MAHCLPITPEEREKLESGEVYGQTILDEDDQVVACFGIILLTPGIAEAWTASTGLASKTERWKLLMLVRRELDAFMRAFDVHRLQSIILSNDVKACRLARAAGFKFEGRLRAFDIDRNDYVVYAKVI